MANVFAPRIRAARGYAGLSQDQLATKLGVDVQWVKRREASKQDTKPGERIAIATACGVPIEFLERGFDSHAFGPADGRLDEVLEITRKLETWESAPVWQRVVANQSELAGAIASRLERIEAKLEEISPTLSPAQRLAQIEEERARRIRERREQPSESTHTQDAKEESA